MKRTISPISMHCTKKQFESIEPILKENGVYIYYITDDWGKRCILVNNHEGRRDATVTNLYPETKEEYDRVYYSEWNAEIFLKACGIVSLLPQEYLVECESLAEVNDVMEKVYDKKDYTSIPWKYVHITPEFTGCHLFDSDCGRNCPVYTYDEFVLLYEGNSPKSKQMKYKNLTVPVTDVLEIHKIACSSWKPRIAKYLLNIKENQTIDFTEKEVEDMFSAATESQKPVLERIFCPLKEKVDLSRIETGSRVYLKYTGHHCDGISRIDLSRPVDVVFFNTPCYITNDGFKKSGTHTRYCTFFQDGSYVLFASHTDIDYIDSVESYQYFL